MKHIELLFDYTVEQTLIGEVSESRFTRNLPLVVALHAAILKLILSTSELRIVRLLHPINLFSNER